MEEDQDVGVVVSGVKVEIWWSHHLGCRIALPNPIFELNNCVFGVEDEVEIDLDVHLVDNSNEDLARKLSLWEAEGPANFPDVDELNLLLECNRGRFAPVFVLGDPQFEEDLLSFEVEGWKTQVEVLVFVELEYEIFEFKSGQGLVVGNSGVKSLLGGGGGGNQSEMRKVFFLLYFDNWYCKV